MAWIDRQKLVWNGKLSWNVDAIYYDKINVDVTHPPYARRNRNTSFFLKTRAWYHADPEITNYLSTWHDHIWNIADIRIIYSSKCNKETGKVYYMCINGVWDKKKILVRDIKDWCVVPNSIRELNRFGTEFENCWCSDNKFFTTNFVKGDRLNVLVEKWGYKEYVQDEWDWIQINKKEWGVMRWYFSDKKVEEWKADFAYNIWDNSFSIGDYLVVYSSNNLEESGFCWQVRMITGVKDWRIMLNAPWLGFKDWGDEVKGDGLSYAIYHSWGEVIGFTSWEGVHVAPLWEREAYLTMCDYHSSKHSDVCIIGSATSNDKIFLLYDNGFVHYGGIGYDKFFFSWEAMYAWEDKTGIAVYREFVLAFGKRNISVGVWDQMGKYYTMYPQSSTIGIKNRWAFHEYNGDMLIASNDNRLLALQIQWNAGSNMLVFQDVWGLANTKLSAMLDTDEVFIGADNNELRVFINSKSDIHRSYNNTKTVVLKFNTQFKIWTEDHLADIVLRGVYEWMFFGDNAYGRKWLEDISGKPNWMRDYESIIDVFILENEDNSMGDSNWNNLDLFRLWKLTNLMLILGIGRYDNDNTKLTVETYRNWFGSYTEVKSFESNEWVKNISKAYSFNDIEIPQCVLDDISEIHTPKQTICEEGHDILKTIPALPWCGFEKEVKLWEHYVCVNDSVYKIAPTMPLSLTFTEQQNYSSQIRITLKSKGWDVLNFGGMLAEIELAPLWYVGADGEFKIPINCED